MNNRFLTVLLLFIVSDTAAQPWMQANYYKAQRKEPGTNLANFYDIQKAFELYENAQDEIKEREPLKDIANTGQGEEEGFAGYAQFKRWENYMAPRVFPSGDVTLPSNNFKNFQQYQQLKSRSNRPAGINVANWTALGPTGSVTKFGDYAGSARVNFIRFDPGNTNTMWLSVPLGGLWKTTNGGASWTSNTDQLPVIGCSDVAINPLNNQIMYLATGDANGATSQLTISSAGILKSTDGGLTWPLASNTLNWQPNLGRSIYKLLINPIHPDTVFAATSFGIYRTLNGGTNWIQVQAGQFTDIEYKPGNVNIIYATSGVFSTGSFYKSTDGGNSFNIITSGLPLSANVGRLEIAVTPADSNYVYVVAMKKNTYDLYGFYRSVDGGNNFTLQSTTPNVLFGAAGSQAWYNLAMAVSPLHRDTILVGGTNMYRSVNGGINWTQVSSENGGFIPYVHPDHHAIEFFPGQDSVYFSCNDGGVFKTTNRGITWTPLNEGLQIAQMYKLGTSPLDPYTILTGHQDMYTQMLQGGSWSIFYRNTGDGIENIYEHDNDSIRYMESVKGRIFVTYNNFPLTRQICNFGGSGVNSNGNWISPFIMNPKADSTLLVGKAQIWRTYDGGQSFSQAGVVTGGSGNLVSLAYAPSDTNFIYAAKSNRVFVATDGNTFVDRTGTLPVAAASITAMVVSNTDPSKLWVTFSGYSVANKVWVSSDTGHTWVNYTTGLPNLPVNCIVYQNASNVGVYVGTDVGVYYRDNDAASWQSFFTGLPNVDVEELEIAYGIGKIRAATNGRGLWESDVAIPVATTFTWVGGISTDWNNPGNWSPKGVPTPLQDVIIPQVGIGNFYPVVNASGMGCRNIQVNTNAHLTTLPGKNFKLGHQ